MCKKTMTIQPKSLEDIRDYWTKVYKFTPQTVPQLEQMLKSYLAWAIEECEEEVKLGTEWLKPADESNWEKRRNMAADVDFRIDLSGDLSDLKCFCSLKQNLKKLIE